MKLFALALYGIVNVAMVAYYFRGAGRFYNFPFWAGVIGLGFFFPQAQALMSQETNLPENAYATGVLFAGICTIALWGGYVKAVNKPTGRPGGWIQARFNKEKLYYSSAFLCVAGFFFMWKLSTLPEEVLNSSQWTGAPVKYIFLAAVFKFGFIALWMMYLAERNLFSFKHILFLAPCLMLLVNAALILGRRAEMMNLFSFLFVSLWFVRHIPIPRWFLILGLAGGLLLINAIGLYRGIMANKDVAVSERLSQAVDADYLSSAEEMADANVEIRNYLYYRQAFIDEGCYDYGLGHWNMFIFNYVPGQIVGQGLKKSLMVRLRNPAKIAKENYNFPRITGSTSTGYKDAFCSFGWFGFIKFWLVGYLMGTLYRHAMSGSFLAQLMYVYGLGPAMHIVTHSTNDILIRIWVYFFALGYPLFRYAQLGPGEQNDAFPVNMGAVGK